ncbi:MAG TPA: globin family protein [Chloroflexota bacterium]|nr:globin family protein [Chloroflexota bacterium]HUM68530.1 globin family protein [Chloroflexota bacterium]
MNQRQIQLVQESFEQVKPIADIAADLFYGRLFELDPSLRPLFKADLSEQKHHLMTTLTFAVSGLHKPERILPAVRQLGVRHMGYGVQEQHYQTVGAALLWTLAQGLGEQFTAEVEEAWTAVYIVLATTMQEAVQETAVA